MRNLSRRYARDHIKIIKHDKILTLMFSNLIIGIVPIKQLYLTISELQLYIFSVYLIAFSYFRFFL